MQKIYKKEQKEVGCKELAILHSVNGNYAPATNYNLRKLKHVQKSLALLQD